MYKLATIEQCITQLAEVHQVLDAIKDETLVTNVQINIMSMIEDLQKVSDNLGQEMDEKI